jgi:outer membrane protein OmpA-like peptidoglycan-associated protein
MNITPCLLLVCLFINYSAAFGGSVNIGLTGRVNSYPALALYNCHIVNTGMTGVNKTGPGSKMTTKNNGHKYIIIDSVPKTNDFTVVIPFEYKQSSLNYSSTFRLIDSVAQVLLKNDMVTLSIDGYSYVDEGSDTICYWLSLNRALAVKYYVLGRGVDSSRVNTLKARSNLRSIHRKVKNEPVEFNCTAEIILSYPIPPTAVNPQDMDEDGILDDEDSCRNDYGDKAHNGCPDKDAIIVPFQPQQSSLYSITYNVLDSVIDILHNDPFVTISIEGHAYKKEGVETICDRLAKERADIVKRYLLTRRIDASRIDSIKSFSNLRPLNAGRNPWEIARNSRAEIFLVHH